MSILGSIFSKILGHTGTPAGAAGAAVSPASITTPTPPIASAPAPATPSAAPPPPTAATPDASAAPAGGAPAPVDVAAMLDGLAAKAGQTLDWKRSIVDMMKLLDLDSSLASRQALARELHYGGDMHDSASMNIWLHKQVMTQLAQNGGKVPADLQH